MGNNHLPPRPKLASRLKQSWDEALRKTNKLRQLPLRLRQRLQEFIGTLNTVGPLGLLRREDMDTMAHQALLY